MRKGLGCLSSCILFIILLLVATFGCTSTRQKVDTTTNSTVVVTNSTPEITVEQEDTSSFKKTTYRTLHTMGTMYNVLMTTAGELRDQDMLSDSQKQKLITLGNLYYASYQTLVLAYDDYVKLSSDTNKLSLLAKLKLATSNYNQLIEQYNTFTTGIKGVQQWTKLAS